MRVQVQQLVICHSVEEKKTIIQLRRNIFIIHTVLPLTLEANKEQGVLWSTANDPNTALQLQEFLWEENDLEGKV